MGQLTKAQMDKLAAQVAVGDRAGYYSTLETADVAYGALAGGVVREDSLSGRMANAFMAEKAAQAGVPMDRNTALGSGLIASR